MQLTLTSTDYLDAGAHVIRERLYEQTGEAFKLEDIRKAIDKWLESSLESLAEECVYHLVEGDRNYAFNRSAFTKQVDNCKPVFVLDEAAEIEAHYQEQLDRQGLMCG